MLIPFGSLVIVSRTLCLCGLLTIIADGLQVTLLDTTKSDSLGWTIFSAGEDDDGVRRGWREASYTDKQSDVYRVYTVCNVASASVDNWLRLPTLVIPPSQRPPTAAASSSKTSSADQEDEADDLVRLYIELRFTMRRCTNYPEPTRLHSCREGFKLLSRQTTLPCYSSPNDDDDDCGLEEVSSTWNRTGYRPVGVVAADRVFAESSDAASTVNVETKGLTVSVGSGIELALRDEGACATVLGIRVYYIVCDALMADFASFPTSFTGPELTSVVQIHGTCVPNAAAESSPSYLCQADGNRYYRTGGCKCNAGYQPADNRSKTECIACPLNTYKWSPGGDSCLPCPARSSALIVGSVECPCLAGHYRAPTTAPSSECTRPPGEIANLSVAELDATSVTLSWSVPKDTGDESLVWYQIDCDSCRPDSAQLVYRPAQSRLNNTRVTVSGLIPGYEYSFSVVAMNSVSETSGLYRPIVVTVTTESSVSQRVTGVRVNDVGVDYVIVTWRDVILPPPQSSGADKTSSVVSYEVRCIRASDVSTRSASRSTPTSSGTQSGQSTTSLPKSVVTNRTTVTFNKLIMNTEYLIAVRWRTPKGWSEFSDEISVLTGQALVQYQQENPVVIIAGSMVAIVVCTIIGLVMITLIIRRGRRSYCEKNASDRDALHTMVGSPQAMDNAVVSNQLESMVTLPRDGSVRTYVDPHTYEDPTDAVREFTKEIDASCIIIESVIGGGEFGDVCCGRLRVPGKPEMRVAIKTLKAGASEKSSLDFLTEASIMGQFDDPNVIYLEGVVTRSNPIMIITEFMQNGSLDRFLRNNDGQFTVLQLIGMLRGIASGMRYLSEIGFVHRDLAARNILVNETLVCKVADFGLSREMESHSSSGCYTTEGGRIPIRWTAPEAIAYRKFSSSSDVWSYGVVAWEVMSYGEYPYWNWSNDDVINVITTSFRLPPPMDCPEAVYQLMHRCWEKERADRPRFSLIVNLLDRLIRSPELLRELAKPRMHDALSLCRPHPSSTSSEVQSPLLVPQDLDVSPPPSAAAAPCYASCESLPVADWLAGIKMERYAGHLEQAGFRSASDAARLERHDLVALGITLAGHQKRILDGAAALRVPSSTSFTLRPQRGASFV